MRATNFPRFTIPRLLWRSRYRVIMMISACILIAGIIALLMKPKYEAKTTLSPASGVWQGELIAGPGGVINRVNEVRLLDGFSPLSLSFQKAEAIGILRSNVLAADLIKRQRLLPIFFPNKWHSSGFTSDAKNRRPNPTIADGVDYFSRDIRSVKFSTKSGLITLEITAPTPALAVKWSKEFVALANNYCRERAIQAARRNVAYLKRQLVNIADYREQRVIAYLIRSQLDAETIAAGSRQYALQIIDPPVEPQERAFPRPLQILSFGAAFGVIAAIWLALARDHSDGAEGDEGVFANRVGVPTHLSPTFVATASAAGGLLLTLFPPVAYRNIIGEPDLMFLDPWVYLFVGLCLAGYLFGNHLALKMTAVTTAPAVTEHGATGVRQRFAITFALVGATIAVVVAGIYIRNAHGYLSAVEQGGAQAIRAAALASLLNNGFIATNVLPVGFPLLLWAAGNIEGKHGKGHSRGVRWAVYGCALIYGLCCIITLSRSLLMPYFLAMLVVLSGTLWHRRGIALKKLITTVSGILGVIVALFLIIAYFRSGATHSPLAMLAGYVPASYNRLAAVLMGRLTPSISGVPYYSFRFLWYPPVVRRIIAIPHMGRDFGWPIPNSMMTGWFSEFSHVASADLNPMFIWPTAFGYTFYDFGWWAPIYFIAVGYLANCLWREFIAGTAYGLILYGYLIASILLWSTDNFLALPGIWVMFGISVILAILERRLLCPPASIAAERRFPSTSG